MRNILSSKIIDILIIGFKQYGLLFLSKLIIYELINIQKMRFFDYIKIQKYNSKLEPCVPTPYYILNILETKLKNKFENAIFIDFGCGKGRVIAFLKKYNFKKLIGIEINSNLKKYLNFKEKNIMINYNDCRDEKFISQLISSNMNNQLILYFYHPFSIDLINKIIELFIIKNKKIIIIIVGNLKIDKKLINSFIKIHKSNMIQIFNHC